MQTLDRALADSVTLQRVVAVLLAAFAALALTLAAVGLYGIVAYAAGERSRELAIRVALGARPRQIFRLVVGRGLALTAVGLVLGLAAAFLSTRALAGFLFGIGTHDPLAIAAAAALLGAIAALSSALPARRAARLDPLRSLHG